MLTRSQFETACKVFVETRSSSHYSTVSQSQSDPGWLWNDSCHTGYGFLSRTISFTQVKSQSTQANPADSSLAELEHHSQTMGELSDDATSSPSSSHLETLISHQYVVYSASFQVPAFYFTVLHTNGVAVTISDIVKSPLFRFSIPEGTETTTYSLQMPASSFPLISQGDHPVLGTACYFLHPCETAGALNELLREVDHGDLSETTWLGRVLEMWFLIVGNTISLTL